MMSVQNLSCWRPKRHQMLHLHGNSWISEGGLLLSHSAGVWLRETYMNQHHFLKKSQIQSERVFPCHCDSCMVPAAHKLVNRGSYRLFRTTLRVPFPQLPAFTSVHAKNASRFTGSEQPESSRYQDGLNQSSKAADTTPHVSRHVTLSLKQLKVTLLLVSAQVLVHPRHRYPNLDFCKQLDWT